MRKKAIIVAVSVLALASGVYLKESAKNRSVTDQGQEPAITTTVLPRLVDLGSDKCIPCKQMAPILDELTREYQESFLVEIIDVRKHPEAGRPYGIRVIPTQVFFDAGGHEVFRHEGFMGKEAILNKWTELGVDVRSTHPGTG